MLCQKNEEFRIEEETGNAGRQIEQKGVSATGNFPNSRDSIKPPLLMETARVILLPKKVKLPILSNALTRISAICQVVFLQFQIVFVKCLVRYFRLLGASFRVKPLTQYVYCTLPMPGARKILRLVCKISKSLRAEFWPGF